MPRFDRILILDWSAAGRPVRGANSIWLGCDAGSLSNPDTRQRAWKQLRCALSRARRAGQRVLIGADFAFGHPAGLAARLTGRGCALALWDHLSALHRDDDRNASNYRDVAAGMNRALGAPVFWGTGGAWPRPTCRGCDRRPSCPPIASPKPRCRAGRGPNRPFSWPGRARSARRA